MKQSPHYYADHINENGDCEFTIANTTSVIDYQKYQIAIDIRNSFLLKTQLRSRHSNSVKYFVYVLLDKTKTGLDAIIGHTCGCKIGERVVGCCSHVAMILWYFGFAQHKSSVRLFASFLNDYFINSSSSEESDTDV